MYTQYFNMTEMPFALLPDTSFFYESENYKAALNVLLVAIRSGEGFVKVTGEVGTGKTMLCRKLLNCLETDNYITVLIPNPFLAPNQLRMALADELGVTYQDSASDDITSYHLMSEITKTLMAHNNAGKRVIVCLDEVQAMPIETLEALRLFSNIETEKSKLMQIILFGQPELDERLNKSCNRQFKQRISFSYKLKPVDRKSLTGYINHRLRIAGYNGSDLFTPKAIDKIYQSSKGVPRLVNTLCNKALILAFGQGKSNVVSKHVKQAINDSAEKDDSNRTYIYIALAVSGMTALAFLLWALQ
ncbi:MAG: AAA family ATPase [Gammaproteobacteria bacterium]|jgi:MSHA biogenesis protein MshM|nr:AAA family ATPase [Gammaproteobacteria bacterium]